MDSKKLEILMTAVNLGSFSKASEVVGYTQPRQVLLALGADAHGVQDFAAKGAFGRKKQVDDAFKKMIHFFFRG